MENLLLVVVCLVAGALARRSGRFPDSTPAVLSRTVIDIALPALTLAAIHGIEFADRSTTELVVALATPWVIFLVALAVLLPIGRALGWPRETVACLLLTAGLANTSFVGFPLVEALFGKDALSTAVWVDQGQFLVLASAGVFVAAIGSGSGRPSLTSVARQLATFPPFIAFVLALGLHSVAFPNALTLLLDKLALLVVPLALLSVGWQLRFDRSALSADGGKLALGLAVRLLIAPAVVFLLLSRGLAQSGRAAHVTIAEAAMAPMITGALLAVESGLSPRLASLMVGVGVPLSLVTVPAWVWALSHF